MTFPAYKKELSQNMTLKNTIANVIGNADVTEKFSYTWGCVGSHVPTIGFRLL